MARTLPPVFGLLGLLLVLGLGAGCTSSDSTLASEETASSETAGSDAVASETTLASATPSSAATAPATELPADDIAPPGSVDYTDPGGSYTLAISPDWTLAPDQDSAAGSAVWLIDSNSDSAENLNVVTVPFQEMEMATVISLLTNEIRGIDPNLSLRLEEVLVGPYGQDLAIVSYDANITGQELSFTQVVGNWGGKNVVVTLTSLQGPEFEDLHVELLPYLLTLRP